MTKWKLGLGVLAVLAALAIFTSRLWTVHIGRSLVCPEEIVTSDAILIENFEPNYVLFERAAKLEKAGVASATFVPVEASADDQPNPVSRAVAEVMARQARLRTWRVIVIRETEPITLNAAVQIRTHLAQENVKSVTVVTSGFRSQRSALVYRAILAAGGIAVYCVPVFGRTTPERWTVTWHGIQEVFEQSIKLQYYRLYVLPFLVPRHERDHRLR